MNRKGASVVIFLILGPPPMGLFFALQPYNVPQKITFLMKIYDIEKKNYASKWKNWKKSILLFSPMSRRRVM